MWYPNVIRLLNAALESLIGFLDDDPIAHRRVGTSKPIREARDKSREIVKTTLANSDYVHYVGTKEDRIALRLDMYNGKFDDATIEEITETPFERYFLACMGVYDATETEMKFQGKTYTVAELHQYFKENDMSVSGSGAVFSRRSSQGQQGLIPSYLGYLFGQRKIVKGEMASHFKKKVLLEKFKMFAEADELLH